MVLINKYKVGLLSLGLMLVVCSSAHALTVQVFTDSTHPVSVQGVSHDIKVTYYNLDRVQSIVSKMNGVIQGQEPQVAALQAKQLLREYNTQLAHAAVGIHYADIYKIKTIPSIIFNHGAYQIVGQVNLSVAIKEYKKWASEKN